MLVVYATGYEQDDEGAVDLCTVELRTCFHSDGPCVLLLSILLLLQVLPVQISRLEGVVVRVVSTRLLSRHCSTELIKAI